VITGQIPYGLFLMIIVAYALGAVQVARRGALVQQINAIEALSYVDVLCMDKRERLQPIVSTTMICPHSIIPKRISAKKS